MNVTEKNIALTKHIKTIVHGLVEYLCNMNK